MTIQGSKEELRREMRARLGDWFSKPDAKEKTGFDLEQLKKRLFSLPETAAAETVMAYLNLPNEFPTVPLLSSLLFNNNNDYHKNDGVSSRRIVIPYCEGDDLRLFLLGETDDLLSERTLEATRQGGAEGTEKEKSDQESDSIKINPIKLSDWNQNCSLLFEREFAKRLAPGAFGILEPSESYRNRPEFQVRPEEIDLILVPGLAFDPQGGRLGKGKGFYDRFFGSVPSRACLVGIAFDWQVVDAIPMESHDRRVDYVLTPNRSLKAPLRADQP